MFSETRAAVRSSPPWEGPTPPGSPWPSPMQSSKGLQVIQKNLWIFRPNLTEAKTGFPVVQMSWPSQREPQGNCIDILLLACLHKLYIWHWGREGQTTVKPKDITDSCSMCPHVRGFLKPEPANWRDRLARKPHRASPETTGCTQPIKFYCHCRPKAWRSQRLETKERGSNSHKAPLMPDFLCNASYHL